MSEQIPVGRHPDPQADTRLHAFPVTRPAGFATGALVLGIGAFLVAGVPALGLLLAVPALGVGVAALVRRESKPIALTGIVLAAAAVVRGLGRVVFVASSSSADVPAALARALGVG
ncbi:hypothetical protein AB3M83_11605 [Microbacterium sp. 179-B 1A2 NHS]|uniref:hypothetical protein n=1 Tax=Microbacterium sp. 179-B 1A2 NHS TaxID=3142383 RepID=UPI00399F1D76